MPRTASWLAAAALAVATPAAARAQQVVTLAGGDRVSGALRRVDGPNWIVFFSGVEVPVPAAQVAGLESATPIGVRLADGTVAAVTVTTVGDSLELTLADGSRRRVPPAAIAAVGPADRLAALVPVPVGWFTPFTRWWMLTANLGLSDQAGNTEAKGFSATVEAERKSVHDRLDIGLGTTRASSRPPGGTYQQTANKSYGYLEVDLYLDHALFATATTRQEQDKFQDLRLRSTYTAGVGVQAVSRPRTDLRFSLLGGLRRESFYSDGVSSEPILDLAWTLAQTLAPAQLTWKTDYTPKAANFADYRLTSSVGVTSGIYKSLALSFYLLDEYNSRPQPGIRNNDLLITTTFTFLLPRQP